MEPGEKAAKKTSIKRVVAIVTLSVLLALLVLVGSFEAWRQTQISRERSALDEVSQQVDSGILKGKTPPEYYNAKAKGKNGWEQFEAMRIAIEDCSPERKEVLSAMEAWGSSHYGDEPAKPADSAAASLWLAATRELAQSAAGTSQCEIISRTYAPSATWEAASIAILPSYRVMRLLDARVKLLTQLNRHDEAAREAVTSARIALLWRDPGILIEGVVFAGMQRLALRTLAETERTSAEDLRSILAMWPDRRVTFERMVEGELV